MHSKCDFAIRIIPICILIIFECTVGSNAQSNCTFTYSNATSGVIESPNFGNGSYPANLSCIYYLQPPNSSYTYVTVTFSTFNTQSASDYVIIHDGSSINTDVILRWTGNSSLPSSTSSTQPYMTIEFTTDASVGASGWNLTFSYKTNKAPICSGTREIPYNKGNITQSVNFTSGSSGTLECRWKITPSLSTGGTRYTVGSFAVSSLSDTSDTILLRVYNGTSTSNTVIASFTNTSMLNSYITSNMTIYGDTLVRMTINQTSNGQYNFALQYNITSVLLPSASAHPSASPHKKSSLPSWIVPAIFGGGGLVLIAGVVLGIVLWRQHKKAQNGGAMDTFTMAGLASRPGYTIQ